MYMGRKTGLYMGRKTGLYMGRKTGLYMGRKTGHALSLLILIYSIPPIPLIP